MMLKAKQNSFLKWFIGIVFLIVALCSFMTTAFAAGVLITCDDCGADFATSMCKKATTTTVAYGIEYIPGIGSQLWTNGNGQYWSVSTHHQGEFSEGKGEKDLCAACVEKRVAAYKASLTLNATVPASLPIHVGEDGKVTTASNASITNNGSKPIVISSINIAASSGWTVQSKVDATNAKAGSKVIAIGFNNSWATPNSGNASGSVNTSDFKKISASGTLNLAYDAVIPVATAGGSTDETAATATIVVAFPEAPTLAAGSGWYKSSEDRNTITKITLTDSYTPTPTADETWAADVNGTGDITCYRTGTEIIMAGNGAGKILANPNSNYMFSHSKSGSDFKKLTAIENLRLLDTSNVTNMSSMFRSCNGLTSIDVSGFDTSKVTNMSTMFYYCRGLTSLDVSGFNTSNVTNMSGMFYNCEGLTSLDASGFDTSNVTNMSTLFYYCSGLTSLDVSGFNTSNVTDMSYMFERCSGLTTLDVSGFDTSNVTDMSYMFYYCRGLTSLDVSGFDTSNVTNMSTMFNNCSGLTSLDVSGFDTSNVTNMSTMFFFCNGLTSLDVSGFDTSNVTNMNSMFNNCSGLTTIYAGDNWNTDKVLSSNRMFYGCTLLKGDIAYNSSYTDKKYAKTSGGYLTYKALPATLAAGSGWYKSSEGRNTITKITLMDSYTPASYDEKWAADVNNSGDITCYRTGTEIIMAGNGAGKIKANPNSNYLFSYSIYSGINSQFIKLISIENLELLDTFNVTNMSGMFYNCEGLTSLDVSNFNTFNVTDMSYMFCSCGGLTSMDISGFDTSNVTDMSYMFKDCSKLTSLNLSNFNTSNVKDMGDMFCSCSGLTTLDISGFDTSNVTDMSYMFERCSGLTTLDVSDFDTSKVTNMWNMFYRCSGLTNIYAGDTWNTDKVTYSDDMFSRCTKLPNFSSSKVDKTAATFTTNGGYLTHKAATKSLKLNVDKSGTVNGYTEQSAA